MNRFTIDTPPRLTMHAWGLVVDAQDAIADALAILMGVRAELHDLEPEALPLSELELADWLAWKADLIGAHQALNQASRAVNRIVPAHTERRP